MMAKPWAKAIAATPGRPTPSPTTAAAPAPMNTNEKVQMNTERSLGAIRLDIILSTDEIDFGGAIRLAPGNNKLVAGRPTARESAAGRRGEPGLLRGDCLQPGIDAQRLCDTRAV